MIHLPSRQLTMLNDEQALLVLRAWVPEEVELLKPLKEIMLDSGFGEFISMTTIFGAYVKRGWTEHNMESTTYHFDLRIYVLSKQTSEQQ